MRILVTGANGMLGRDVVATLRTSGHTVLATDLPEVDILDEQSCARAARGADWVVNTAAYTAVDAAESNEALAFRVNALGPSVLGRAARLAGSRVVHISTDYVFNGTATSPYAEDAHLDPRSAYGRSKAAGEWAVRAEAPDAVIVRTAWLYGPGGPNMAKTVARLAHERDTLTFVDDQRGQPTTTSDVAQFIAELMGRDAPAGVYHGTSQGDTTWWGFARAVVEELGMDPDRVKPIGTADYPLPAARPAFSVLGHDRTRALGVPLLPHWREALSANLAAVLSG